MLRKFLQILKRQQNPEPPMKIFSQEKLEQLADEHRLVCLTLARLQQSREYTRNGTDTWAHAQTKLLTRKVELDAMIDTLRDFLES